MKKILLILLFFFTLNVNNSRAQICMSYSYIDSIYTDNENVYSIKRHDTCVDNTHIQKIYITDIYGDKFFAFVDSICYISISFFNTDGIKADNMIIYLNENYNKKNLLWYGKNNEVVDFTFVSQIDTKGLKIDKWVLTIMHGFLIKY